MKRVRSTLLALTAMAVAAWVTGCGRREPTPAASELGDGLAPNARVPVLVYHAWGVGAPCDYAHHAMRAFETDLETIHRRGFRVVPVEWLAEWALGERDGSTLPARAIGITFDDGPDLDWMDGHDADCGEVKSVRRVLQEFRVRHPDLPDPSPQATSFAIASPLARSAIQRAVGNVAASDEWWSEANASQLMAIHNHGLDHDHTAIAHRSFDAVLHLELPGGGYGQGDWRGRADFTRIDHYAEASAQVEASARFIADKTGRWPRLFAYPFAQSSWYLREIYFPLHGDRHRTSAAFCAGNVYLTRSSPRFCLPRINYGGDPAVGDWRSPAGLQSILDFSLQGEGPLRRSQDEASPRD